MNEANRVKSTKSVSKEDTKALSDLQQKKIWLSDFVDSESNEEE
jgi:hypothetical protein